MKSRKSFHLFEWAIALMCLILMAGCGTQSPRIFVPEPVETGRHIPPAKEPQSQAPTSNAPPPEASLPEPSVQSLPKEGQRPPEAPVNSQSPMVLASLTLTDQGRGYLERKKPDEAIRVLERAVNMNPRNGENYYYLAEAWLLKKNAAQAAEFNHLAGIRLKSDPGWMQKVRAQKGRISELR